MLQNHSPFVAVMKSFSLAHPKIFFTYFFVFPAAPIFVNPPLHPPIVVFLFCFFLSLLLLISPAAPWVYWCLCFLIFNLGLCFLFVWFFFLLLLQSETFLDFFFFFFPPSQFISHSSVFVYNICCCVSFCEWFSTYHCFSICNFTSSWLLEWHSLVNCGSVGAVRTVFIGEAGG